MEKLKREAHMFYIKAPKATNYYLVGKDIDDMSVEMNGSFEQKQDITGQSSVSDSGYQPQVLQIVYNVWPDGNRQEGTVTMNDKVPTFTAKNTVSSASNE